MDVLDPPRTIHLVGGFRLGEPCAQPARAGQRVLALLALRGPTSRPTLAATLWPEVGEARASGSLRSALWRLRRGGIAVERHPGGRLALPAALVVDVDGVVTLSHRLEKPGDDDLAGTVVPRGELLAGWDDEWIAPERERFHHLRLATLEALAHRYARSGRFADAVEAALRATELDPLRESAVRALVHVHLRQGAGDRARLAYEHYRAALHRELGVEPSPELARLVARPR